MLYFFSLLNLHAKSETIVNIPDIQGILAKQGTQTSMLDVDAYGE